MGRETRQGLRKLAQQTVTEVRDLKILLEDLDKNEDPVLLKTSLDKMKDLMIETLKTLKEALEKYNSAVATFEKLNHSIATQNRNLEKMTNKNSAEYKAWTEKVRGGLYGTIAGTTVGCIVADALGGFGLCSLTSAIISIPTAIAFEAEIAIYSATLEKLKSITGRMLESGYNFDNAINEAIEILTEEIDLINNWPTAPRSLTRTLTNILNNISKSIN